MFLLLSLLFLASSLELLGRNFILRPESSLSPFHLCDLLAALFTQPPSAGCHRCRFSFLPPKRQWKMIVRLALHALAYFSFVMQQCEAVQLGMLQICFQYVSFWSEIEPHHSGDLWTCAFEGSKDRHPHPWPSSRAGTTPYHAREERPHEEKKS